MALRWIFKAYTKKILAVCLCFSTMPILLSHLNDNQINTNHVEPAESTKFYADYDKAELSYGAKNQTKENSAGPPIIKLSLRPDPTVDKFHHLCVVDAKSAPYYVQSNPRTPCKVPRKELVIYNSRAKVYTLSGMPDVKYLPDPLPSSFTIVNTLALISSSRYLNNMNHFWREFMFPMAHLLWNSGIPRGIKPLLLFSRPPINHCSNGTTMPPALLRWLDTFARPILNVEMIEDDFNWRMYHSLPHGTCFPTSILFNPVKYSKKTSPSALNVKMRRNLMHLFNLTLDSCGDQDKIVTFISRKGDREIVNEVELQKAAKESGYNMQIVAMETLSLREQARQVMCSKVLIGVQGAGLTWAIIMQNDASLIEIAWPKLGWDFRYSTKEMKDLWPRVKTFQITPSRIIQSDDHYGLLKRYYGYMATAERNISTAATELMGTFQFKRETIIIDVLKLLSFVERSEEQNGLGTLEKGLEFAFKKKKLFQVTELLRTTQKRLSPAAFKILTGLTGAMTSITHVAKKHQGYISVREFVALLANAAR